jgi:hypothetical protein
MNFRQRCGKFIPDGRGIYEKENLLETYDLVSTFKRYLNQYTGTMTVDVVVDYVNGNNCQGLFHSMFGRKENDEAIEAMGHLPVSKSTVHQWMLIIGEARYDTVQKVNIMKLY